MFDTGAGTTTLTREGEKQAGVKPDSAGVVDGGLIYGVGRHPVQSWIATFDSFKIGDEEVRNARLRLSDARLPHSGMLIGADFFLSHRIYVASSQHKLYFTYNGGTVFNLTETVASTSAQNPASNGVIPAESAPADGAAQPTDAAGYSRRGTAFAARRDFEHAITDLTRACELAPNEPSYFYQRGMAHWENKQPALAMADFDQALKLKPDELSTLVARAELHMRYRDNAAGIVDLNAADRIAPKEADVRMRMADLYLHAGEFAAAVSQYSLWIGVRDRNDVLMPQAMNARCRARALWGRELEQALADCNTALKLTPDNAAFLDSRGLVQLRRGDYDKAITDYDRGTRLQPKSAWPQYGRGVAKLRKGLTTAGEADIAAATALQPNIAEEAKKYGIIP
jgi:tetratricopeptide (TPR) repeat protein